MTLTRRTRLRPGKPLARTGRVRPISNRRRAENTEYLQLRDVYLQQHPWCEFPAGCRAPSTEIQHRRGRNGRRLLDVAWWAASCRAHNDWAETNTGEALACGWLVRINGTAP